jgi:hypothetical protein
MCGAEVMTRLNPRAPCALCGTVHLVSHVLDEYRVCPDCKGSDGNGRLTKPQHPGYAEYMEMRELQRHLAWGPL